MATARPRSTTGELILGVQLGCQVDLSQGGNITTMGLGKKALKGTHGEITVHDAHVKVDGCGGPVVIRFFAYAGISTDNGDDSVNTYGDILPL